MRGKRQEEIERCRGGTVLCLVLEGERWMYRVVRVVLACNFRLFSPQFALGGVFRLVGVTKSGMVGYFPDWIDKGFIHLESSIPTTGLGCRDSALSEALIVHSSKSCPRIGTAGGSTVCVLWTSILQLGV